MNTKQVIIARTDLNMPVGKAAAQVSHASIAFLTRSLYVGQLDLELPDSLICCACFTHEELVEIDHWLRNSFRKIVVAVDSEEELLAIHQKALDNGFISHIVEDNGATVFNGVKTLTCCAIGPMEDSKFVGLTDHLRLL